MEKNNQSSNKSNNITEHNCQCGHQHGQHKHEQYDCNHNDEHQDARECGHNHATSNTPAYGYLENVGTKENPKYVRMCVLEEGELCTGCGACNICDLDPTKICDNCGKCLDTIKTNDKGYVEIPAKIVMNDGDQSLEDLLAAYGLDDDEDEDNSQQ